MADIRIPNLPTGKMVDENGVATDGEATFRRILITSLQNNFGNEGVVVPTQNPTDVLKIQNNSVYNPATGMQEYTCQLGTILYEQNPTDYTMDRVLIAVRNDNTYPATAPVFKQVTLI
jgi:hypothetical protein